MYAPKWQSYTYVLYYIALLLLIQFCNNLTQTSGMFQYIIVLKFFFRFVGYRVQNQLAALDFNHHRAREEGAITGDGRPR